MKVYGVRVAPRGRAIIAASSPDAAARALGAAFPENVRAQDVGETLNEQECALAWSDVGRVFVARDGGEYEAVSS